MISDLAQLYIQGILIGSTICFFSCSPLVFSLVVGTCENWKKSLLAVVFFSSGRLLMYVLFGILIGLGRQIHIDRFVRGSFHFNLQILAGLFILVMGILVLLNKQRPILCPNLDRFFIKEKFRSFFLLGVILGMTPCPALIAAFAFIFLRSSGFVSSLSMVTAFGLGTITSPLIPLCLGYGLLSKWISRTVLLSVLRWAAGAILVFWGTQIILAKMGYVIYL